MNIIFLDIDGVLNSLPYMESVKYKNGENSISNFHVKMLSKLYHKFDAKIVLTSTWRELDDSSDETCYKVYKYLVDSLAFYNMDIYSKTPVIENNRPLEIATWLDSRTDKDVINFVILDDDFSKEDYDLYGLSKNLVHTTFFGKNISDSGLQQSHIDKAIIILNKQIDERNENDEKEIV